MRRVRIKVRELQVYEALLITRFCLVRVLLTRIFINKLLKLNIILPMLSKLHLLYKVCMFLGNS